MSKTRALLLAGDVCLAALAAAGFLPAGWISAHAHRTGNWRQAVIFAAIAIFSSHLADFYSEKGRTDRKTIFLKSVMTFVISMFVFSVLYILAPSVAADIKRNAAYLSIFCIMQLLWHLGFNAFIGARRLARKVLVVGTGPLARTIGGAILGGTDVLQGYYQCASEQPLIPFDSIVKNGEGLLATAKREKANKIVISVSDRRGSLPVDDILHCKFSGIEVVDAPSFYEQTTGKLLIENLRPSWFIFSDGFRVTGARKFLKRGGDILLGLLGLVLSAPVMPLIALAIKADSSGPVFFRQTRVGEKERQFVIYKFRTMRASAEDGTGAVWASRKDPRITHAGLVLRKTRLDELPQLFNVIKGDMSFVGPRPERPEFVKKLKKAIPYYSERHFVKPGLTGWAQVRFRYGASVEDAIEKLRYDLYYIKHMSLFLDFYIVLETIKVVLFDGGSR